MNLTSFIKDKFYSNLSLEIFFSRLKLISSKELLLLFFKMLILFSFFTNFSVKSQEIMPEKVYIGNADKGKIVAGQICSACHASDGNSKIPTNPILAGQHSAYLKKQLHNFQVKEGSKKAMRENAVMLGFASTLNDGDIADLAAYYSNQKIIPSYASDKDLALSGELLYKGGDSKNGIPACSSCHGPKGVGIPDQYPRLAGQYAEYTKSTLLAFKKGIRANSKQMMTISHRMSEKQIDAISEYLAGLR